MYDKLMKKMDKKDKKLNNPLEKEAKMGVVKELSRQAGSMMGDKLNGMKKVTVAADSKPELEKGLDKAKELIHGKALDPEEALEDPAEEATESPAEEHAENADEEHMDQAEIDAMSPEQIDEEIKKLLLAKAKKLHA